MEDSFIIANFHALCRLCLCKSTLMVSVFGAAPDDDLKQPLTSKIADCSELDINPNDGLPGQICYKCLYKLEKCCKFKLQCVQNENRLKKIINDLNEANSSNSSEQAQFNYSQKKDQSQKIKNEYVVEESVVMVVDPSLDCDSSGDSDDNANIQDQDNMPDGEPMPESYYRNVAMCQYCDQAFVSQEKCDEHEQAYHDPNLPYNCVECSLVFAERSQSIQHIKQVHGSDKPYTCPECEKCFGRRSDLRKHSIVHTGIRPYQCNYCYKNFSRNTNLSKHLRIHAGQKPHVCPLCPRSFVARGDLERHVLVHSGKKPFACQKCPMTFSRRDKLLKHEVHIHGIHRTPNNDQETQDMVVNVNPFSNMYDLPRVPDHISGEGSFINQQQSQRNASSSKLTQNSPTKPKPLSNKNRPKNIKCHQCPKRFSSLDAYKSHVSLAHIGSRGFQCKICFKKFSRKRDLDKHVAMHSGMKPFSCGKCEEVFTSKADLVKHEETHECLVVNLPCIECGATFEKKADLVAHIKSHFVNEFEDKNPQIDIDKDKKDFALNSDVYNLES